MSVSYIKSQMNKHVREIIIPACHKLKEWSFFSEDTKERPIDWSIYTVAILLAIMRQESDAYQFEQNNGPATSLWQFEGGHEAAIQNIIANRHTVVLSRMLLREYYNCFCPDVSDLLNCIKPKDKPLRKFIHGQFAKEDRQDLACMFARLNLTFDGNDIEDISMCTDVMYDYTHRRVVLYRLNVIDMAWTIYRRVWMFRGWNANYIKIGQAKPEGGVYTSDDIVFLQRRYNRLLTEWRTETWPWTVEIMGAKDIADQIAELKSIEASW